MRKLMTTALLASTMALSGCESITKVIQSIEESMTGVTCDPPYYYFDIWKGCTLVSEKEVKDFLKANAFMGYFEKCGEEYCSNSALAIAYRLTSETGEMVTVEEVIEMQEKERKKEAIKRATQ